MWLTEARKRSERSWNAPQSATGTSTVKLLLTGLPWTRKHGNNSTKQNPAEN